MGATVLILFVVLMIEKGLKPRMDLTKKKELIIWYGDADNRKYLKIL
jgi:hypothetical protein